MRNDFHIAAAAAALMLFSAPAGVAVAQNVPNTGTGTATAPATTTDPATTTAPAATPAPAAAATATTTEQPDGAKKNRKPAKKLTRQQEIDRSIDSGTVPARYRRSVPKEYQQYIPFDKR